VGQQSILNALLDRVQVQGIVCRFRGPWCGSVDVAQAIASASGELHGGRHRGVWGGGGKGTEPGLEFRAHRNTKTCAWIRTSHNM
jgi:hypothetical protein